MKTDSELATLLTAFAHPTRIAVLRCLLSRCPNGLNFGEMAAELDLSPSTLTHHLHEMERAGVLVRKAAGRSTSLGLNHGDLFEAASQLSDLCCAAASAMSPEPKDFQR